MVNVVLFMVNLAFAQKSPSGWLNSFNKTFQQEGLSQAVADALAKGVTTSDLATKTLSLSGVNPHDAISTLVAAGANQAEVQNAATKAGISSIVIMAAIADGNEIRAARKEGLAFTPEAPAPTPTTTVGAGLPGGSSGGGFVSPGGF